jgi:hypothetical protein
VLHISDSAMGLVIPEWGAQVRNLEKDGFRSTEMIQLGRRGSDERGTYVGPVECTSLEM